ncbi:MAG: amidohydrolase family protein [Steroidobacteraceae bacterium]
MPDRTTWLDRTRETALEPGLPICDPHHHLWEHPGSRYLLDEFLHDVGSGHRIVATVYVECVQHYRSTGPIALQPVGETEFVHRVTASHQGEASGARIAAGIIGFADLTLGKAVMPVLRAHLDASDRFRGIRYASAWDASPEIRVAHTRPPPGLLREPAFRKGFACLARLGLSFDAWLYHAQFGELAELAREFPDVTIVLDHMGGPLGIGPYAGQQEALFAEWRAALARLSSCDNVFIKLGGRTLTLAGFGWHRRDAPPGSEELASASAPYYTACIDLFSPGRCMFESNFPVDRASCSYAVLWNAFKRLSRRYSDAERAALFHDTAARAYGLA